MDTEPPLLEAVTDDLVDVPAGEIVLRDEGTRRNWRVELAASRLARYPVTHRLWSAVTADASAGAGPRTPVTDVSWTDAVRFCNLLSSATGLAPCYSVGDDPD